MDGPDGWTSTGQRGLHLQLQEEDQQPEHRYCASLWPPRRRARGSLHATAKAPMTEGGTQHSAQIEND